jgi:hypothetical protein
MLSFYSLHVKYQQINFHTLYPAFLSSQALGQAASILREPKQSTYTHQPRRKVKQLYVGLLFACVLMGFEVFK